MKQHELNGKTILLVEVPRNTVKWNPLHIIYGRYGMSIAWWGKARFHHPLPDGDWKFFATTDTITEQQAAELVDTAYLPDPNTVDGYSDEAIGYVDYGCPLGVGSFATAKESFQSWLFVNGISGNQAVLIKG